MSQSASSNSVQVRRFTNLLNCTEAPLNIRKFYEYDTDDDFSDTETPPAPPAEQLETVGDLYALYTEGDIDHRDHQPSRTVYHNALTDYRRTQFPNAKRGDLVIVIHEYRRYRNGGLFVFNGDKVVELEDDYDEYEHIPRQFVVSSSLPLGFFNREEENGEPNLIVHNNINWFEFKQEWIDEIANSLTIIENAPAGPTLVGFFEAPANLINTFPADSTEMVRFCLLVVSLNEEPALQTDEDFVTQLHRRLKADTVTAVNFYTNTGGHPFMLDLLDGERY
jgi:hypothetical protein